MKVSRFYARLSIICCDIYLVIALYGIITHREWLGLLASPFFFSAVLIHYFKVSCGNCGNKLIPLQWFKGGNKKCRKCGQFLEYDK